MEASVFFSGFIPTVQWHSKGLDLQNSDMSSPMSLTKDIGMVSNLPNLLGILTGQLLPPNSSVWLGYDD